MIYGLWSYALGQVCECFGMIGIIMLVLQHETYQVSL